MKQFWKEQVLPTVLAVLAGVLTAFILLAVLAGGFGGAVSAIKYAAGIGVIQRYYVGDYDIAAVTDSALSGAVDSLGDRWSYYMDSDTYEAYQDASANRYQGIGVTITQDDETGGFLIMALTKDGPAQQAGLLEGDIILAVDGVDVTGGTMEDLKALIQADFGRDALVTVLRADGTREDIPVSCEEVFSNPVSYEMLDGNVGYIRLENFRSQAGAEAIAAVEALREQGAESLVFDVRSNPGGQVSEMVELLDYLLPEGDLFVRADKRGHEVVETSDAECVELPMAVVVNSQSYSAAEFFAAALREYDWAVVAGEATTGKARSQVTASLWDGSAIHLSRYTYLTPARVDLYEAGGIVPDAAAELTEDEQLDFDTGWLEPGEDPQILAAIAAIEP